MLYFLVHFQASQSLYLLLYNHLRSKIYLKIKERSGLLHTNPQQGRIVPELKSFGDKYREIIIKPWRILYSINNKIVNILLVIDGRRDLEEILFEIIVKVDRP